MRDLPIGPEALDRRGGIPLHRQLATLLQAAVESGRLRAGDQLPAEVEIGARLGLARGTVREAVRQLAEAGLLERRHGAGTFVAAGHQQGRAAAGDLAATRASYLDALLAGDGDTARALLTAALQHGAAPDEVAEDVLLPSAYAVGELWHENIVSVAVEHRASAIIGRDLAELHRRGPRLPERGRTLVIGCIAGELHEIGCRMVADRFERDGWTVHFLGADVPLDAFVTLARAVKADLVAVSATMPAHLAAVAELVRALRAAEPAPPVLAGGRVFLDDPGGASSLGVWRTAATATEAIRLVNLEFEQRASGEAGS